MGMGHGKWAINTVAVQSLVNTLASLHAVRWLANVPPAAFDKPQLVATFTTSADDKAQHKVTISGPSADGTSTARTDEHEGTFLVSSSNLSALRGALAQAPSPSPAASASPSVAASPVAPPTP